MYSDESGHFGVGVLLGLIALGVGALALLKGDSYIEYTSSITYDDLNINGNNPNGRIIVNFYSGDNRNGRYIEAFQIVNSYLYTKYADIERIIDIIMSSDEYQNREYNLSKREILSEWNAHNFAHLFPFGKDWKDKTGSVDINKKSSDDPFSIIYWLF